MDDIKSMRNTQNIKKSTNNPTLSIVIIAAGIGSKTKSFGTKSLFEIRGQTLIQRQLDTIYSVYPNIEIILVAGFEAYKVYKRLANIYTKLKYVFIDDYENTNQVYSILNGVLATNSTNILLIYGDILFNKFTINDLDLKHSYLLADTNKQISRDKVGIHTNENNIVEILHHGIKNKWAQIVLFSEYELSLLKKLFLNRESYRWLGYEAINYIIKNGGQFIILDNKKQNIREISTYNSD